MALEVIPNWRFEQNEVRSYIVCSGGACMLAVPALAAQNAKLQWGLYQRMHNGLSEWCHFQMELATRMETARMEILMVKPKMEKDLEDDGSCKA